MENENLRNIENLLAAKASTQPLYEFPVDQLPLGLRDSLSGVAAEARVPALFSALPIAATDNGYFHLFTFRFEFLRIGGKG